jgi:hypothetical protein
VSVIFLDSGPLGLLTHPQRSEEVIAIAEWLSRAILAGDQVIVPAIVYFEIKARIASREERYWDRTPRPICKREGWTLLTTFG